MKKITRASIMGELVDKFLLQEHEKEDFLFGESVLPTYDIGKHVKQWELFRARKLVTGNGWLPVSCVSDKERHYIRKMNVIHEAGANFDIDQIFFYKDVTHYLYVFFDPTSPIVSGDVKIFDFPQDIVLEKKNIYCLYINVSNFVAGGYVVMNVLREVEQLR